jgi:D-2-hydroxyacid dehydrogenase (NADP+)
VVGVFVTETVWATLGDQLVDACPEIEPIVFVTGQRVTADDIARIEVACLSPDLWTDGSSSSYMRVVLDSPNLRWLHTCSAGVDHPVFGVIRSRARLTTSSGASAVPIAQHVVMMLMAMRHDLPRFAREQAAHQWESSDVGDIEGTTVAVIGMGPIGYEVARMATALGMRPTGVRRTVVGDEPCDTWTFARLDELVATVDAVVLAVPLTDDTRRLFDARRLALLRPGTHLVNVGRGELVDEDALIDALRSGQVGFAALDVTTVEPLPADSPLWDLPNVIITPHSSGGTESSNRRAVDMFVENLGHFASGRALRNEVV